MSPEDLAAHLAEVLRDSLDDADDVREIRGGIIVRFGAEVLLVPTPRRVGEMEETGDDVADEEYEDMVGGTYLDHDED